jgi:DNA-directed RNA polymerase specialized sigma24 family protein
MQQEDERQQQVLQLRFGAGPQFAQIAALLNKREATIRKLCSRSIAHLRTIYEQQEKGTV